MMNCFFISKPFVTSLRGGRPLPDEAISGLALEIAHLHLRAVQVSLVTTRSQ